MWHCKGKTLYIGGFAVADKTLEMALLFDFFGDLLTEKQREYFDLYYNEDLSLSEIAENEGISRQGVRDIIVRAENSLRDAENKTGIIKRFTEMQSKIFEIEKHTSAIIENTKEESTRALAVKISDKLQDLKG